MRTNEMVRPPAHENARDDLALIEMANLPESDTGIPGWIYVSSRQGTHAPRVNYYVNRPARRPPCLSVVISDEAPIFNHPLPVGVAQEIGAQIGTSDSLLAGYIVFLAVLVLRPQGLVTRRAQS